MAKIKTPWFCPWEVEKFLASPDVSRMTNSEVGQYFLLLSYQWQSPHCHLPSDPKQLAILARTGDQEVSPLVMSKFPCRNRVDGTTEIRNEKLYSTWLKAVKKSQAAVKSIRSRWDNKDTNVLRPAYERNTTNNLDLDLDLEPVCLVGGGRNSAEKNPPEGAAETVVKPTCGAQPPDTNVSPTHDVRLNLTWVPALKPLIDKHGATYVADVIDKAKEGGFWKLKGVGAVLKNWELLAEQFEDSKKPTKRSAADTSDFRSPSSRIERARRIKEAEDAAEIEEAKKFAARGKL